MNEKIHSNSKDAYAYRRGGEHGGSVHGLVKSIFPSWVFTPPPPLEEEASHRQISN